MRKLNQKKPSFQKPFSKNGKYYSKSFDNERINSNHQKQRKLRPNNYVSNFSIDNNKENIRAKSKSKSDPEKKSNKKKLFSSNKTESKENIKYFFTPVKKKPLLTKEENNESQNKEKEYIFRTYLKTIKIDLYRLPKSDDFVNLKYVEMNNISSIFNAYQSCSSIYKAFENKLLEKNHFEINTKTLKLITKSSEASNVLKKQKFWILYIEYLIDKNMILNEEKFISLINYAFSYMEEDEVNPDGYPCHLLKKYYLEKIKKWSPCFLPNGDFDDNDDTYINKLDKAVVYLINSSKNDFKKINVFDKMKLH